jgi:peptide/nickel transport system substrate-binding protein
LNKLRRYAWMLASLLTLLSFSAAGAVGANASSGSTLTLSVIGIPATIDPITVQDVPGADLDSLIYDGLVMVAPNLSAVPDLATKWSVSKDGKTWTFWLNPKATWQDGQPVTAADVEWTYQQYANPANGAPGQSYFQPISGYTIVNPHEIEIHLSHPFGPFLLGVGPAAILPKHVLDKYKPGNDLNNAPELNQHPVGSGPYILTTIKQGDYYQLKANPNYFLGKPKVQTIIYKIVSDQNTAVAQLKTGELDYAGVPAQDVPAVQGSPGITLYKFPQMSYTYIGFNFKDPIFKNPLTRLAMYYAIDRQAIVKNILHGYGQVANGIVPPISWAYDPHLKNIPYDPNMAKKLLAQAGWKRGGDGILYDPKTGEKLAFDLGTNAGNPVRAQIAQVVQAELAKVGIQLKISSIEWNTFINDYLLTGRYQTVLIGWLLTADPDQSTIFESDMINGKGQNFGYYSDPIVDKYTQAELNTSDQNARQLDMWAIQEEMQKNPPYIFLFYPDAVVGTSARFGGYQPNPVADFYQPYKWYIKQ